MRIPSEFSDDNLYRDRNRAKNRQGISTSTARRLMRMVVALALVVVVMNTASKKALYEPFFPATLPDENLAFADAAPVDAGVSHAQSGTDILRVDGSTSPDGQAPSEKAVSERAHSEKAISAIGAQPSYWFFPNSPDSQSPGKQDRPENDLTGDSERKLELVGAVVDSLPRQDRLQWALAINRFAVGHWEAPVPSSLELIGREIDSHESPQSVKDAFQQALDHLVETRTSSLTASQNSLTASQNRGDDPAASRSNDRRGTGKSAHPTTTSRSFLSEPDRRWLMLFYERILDVAFSDSIDGTVWRSSDRDLLRLLLEQSKWDSQIGRRQAKQVGVIPLLQQPQFYLGKRVGIVGTVARVERIEPKNDLERSGDATTIPDYFQIWLRPRDGAERPIVAVVADLPDRIASLAGMDSPDEEIQVAIAGTFAKRLAYQSGKGADLAPVVVGAMLNADRPKPSPGTAQSGDLSPGQASAKSRTILVSILAAIVVGLLISILIMWRTRVSANRTRQLRKEKQSDTISFMGSLLIGVLCGCFGAMQSDRALCQEVEPSRPTGLSLVSGFDVQRLEKVYPFSGPDAVAESAKLLDRLRRVSPETIQAKAAPLGDRSQRIRGDLHTIEATLRSTKLVKVPDSLAEFLEFNLLSYSVFDVERPDAKPMLVRVVSLPLPKGVAENDSFSLAGILVSPTNDLDSPSSDSSQSDSPSSSLDTETIDEIAMVCPVVRWFPTSTGSPSHAFLASAGMDISKVAELASRDREPLSSADSDAFYQMMRIGGDGPANVTPERVESVDLLRDSTKMAGTLVSIPLETIQIIRVEVADPLRQEQLGQDHYFQIDAMGDLAGAVKIEIPKSEETPDGGEVLFENRYPISIVTKNLPDFLAAQLQRSPHDHAAQRDVRVRMEATGYFFRLWSYATDFMDDFGEKKQFGPLIIGESFKDLEVRASDPIGVRWIGAVAACLIALGMFGIFVWHQKNRREDDLVKRQRGSREIDVRDLHVD